MRDLEAVYTEYSRMVYWTAFSVVKSDADAADTVQNVFLRVIKHMGKLSDMNDAQLKGWLYRVTMNLCMDKKRRDKRETPTDELFDSEVQSTEELPETAAITKEQRQLVKNAIEALPDIYRQTVMLHYFSELGYEEIAQLEGVSEGTIKSRMSRAKAKLLNILRDGEMNG